MDITPKQFNALLAELKKIREHLETLRDDFNQRCEAIYAVCERQEQRHHELPLPLEIKLEKDQEGKRTAESSGQYKVQNSIRKAAWFTFGATFLAFVAAAIYAYIAAGQLHQMRTAFKVGEKAYIVVTDIRWRVDRTDEKHPTRLPGICDGGDGGQHICFEIDFDNGARTPASETRILAQVLPRSAIPHARDQVDRFTFARLDKPSGFTPASPGPHEWNAFSAEEVCDSSACIPTDDAEAMVDGKAPLYIYGVIQYRDIFGDEHASRFCYYQPKMECTYPPGGCMDSCPFGNYLDKSGDVPPVGLN